jgi:imidazolonepropionase-like amidohydrolase
MELQCKKTIGVKSRGFRNVTVFYPDGYRMNQSLIIGDTGLIESVGPAEFIDSDYFLEDASDLIVFPGFIDCHTHFTLNAFADPYKDLENTDAEDCRLKALKNLESTIRSGVTLIRDLGGRKSISADINQHISPYTGKLPDVCNAVYALSRKGGHGSEIGLECFSSGDFEKHVEFIYQSGGNVVKIMASGGAVSKSDKIEEQFSKEEISWIVQCAHNRGMKVASHAHTSESIRNCILGGVDSVEHGTFMDEESINLFLKFNTFLVPTLSAPYYLMKYGKENGTPDFILDKIKLLYDVHLKNFITAYKAGVKIAMGSDAGSPLNDHGKNLYEIILMVEAGVKSEDAVKFSTVNGAQLLGVENEAGTVEIGKRADLVLFRGNSSDLGLLNNLPVKVIKNGNVVY